MTLEGFHAGTVFQFINNINSDNMIEKEELKQFLDLNGSIDIELSECQ